MDHGVSPGFASWVNFGILFGFSTIQFPHLYSEVNSIYMSELFWALNEMRINHLAQCLGKKKLFIQLFIHIYCVPTTYVSAYIIVERNNLNEVNI